MGAVAFEEIFKRAERPLTLLPTASERKRLKRQPDDTAGPAWFNMPAPQMTPELENDLRLVNLRPALDPKQHYKRPDKQGVVTSKYFQVGTVVEDATGYYTDRISKKKRGVTLVDAILKDEERRHVLKKRFSESQRKSRLGRNGRRSK